MEVVMNHTQFLEWRYGNKTTVDIKLENLGIIDSRKFENQLVTGLGIALFVIRHAGHHKALIFIIFILSPSTLYHTLY